MKGQMVPSPPPPPAISSTTTTGIPSSGLVVALMGSMNSLWALWKKKPKTKKLSNDSSLAISKNFLAKISGKAGNFRIKKKAKKEKEGEDFGEGGVWQKEILMGDKCKPLDFSGVIYYDRNGKQLSEMPVKSPRTSPLPSYLYAEMK